MTTDMATLRRYQWVAWALMLFGVLASLAGNVLYAPANPIAQAISALPALSFLGTMWLLERIPWDWRTLLSYVARLALLSVAGVSAWISYWHMVDVALSHGQEGSSAYLLPVPVDGLILASSLALIRLGLLRSQEASRPREGGEDQQEAPALPVLSREVSPVWEQITEEEASSPAFRPLPAPVREKAPRESVFEETVTETKTTTRRATLPLTHHVERMREAVAAGEVSPTISAAKTFLGVGHSRAKAVMEQLSA